ncbi:MAG: hypothetical protein OEW52_10350 [Thermoleophilia bacterium]|nr:hypothetical protein [Thermoleophilia bacterium]MDH4340920.1 hypothetical protein [Thermoleophilia bacterium]MDH5281532.1 hypothetical protein [Thermoleophilia bacterium]
MKATLWTWTALCAGIVTLTFFAAPAWDTSKEGWELFSGAEVFGFIAVLMGIAWLAGLGVLATIVALVRIVRRNARVGAWWGRRGRLAKVTVVVLAGTAAVALIGGMVAQVRSGEDATSNFVSFGTVDADPDWSPDGRWIAFATTRGRGGIYLIRPDGTGMRRVYRGTATDVDWSPDGKTIAFVGSRGVYVLRVDKSKPRLFLRGGAFSLPAWAPNGRELAVVRDEPGVFALYGGGSFKFSAPAIHIARLGETRSHRLLPRYRGSVGAGRPGSVAAVSETDPAWSPDGRRITFQAGDGVIVVVDVKTGRRTSIGGGYEPAWSPDGRLIAYQCYGDVCAADADGSGRAHRIASGGGDPSWSRDSRLVVFERYLYGGAGWGSHPQSLAIVGVNGEGQRDLTYGHRLP